MLEGVLVEEALDKYGFIFDYAASKPFFQEWRAEMLALSGGKSEGNVRVMHGLWPAGLIPPGGMVFDDAARAIRTTTKIVEPEAIKLVLEGVLTSFSMGADFARPPWPDPDNPKIKRMACKPKEMSLVDNPGQWREGAGFEVVRADGSVGHVACKGGEMLTADKRDKLAGLAARLEAVVTRATGANLAATAKVLRGMCGVAELAQLLVALKGCFIESSYERDAEQDTSPIPERLADLVVGLGDVLVAMVEEEVGELVADLRPAAGAGLVLADQPAGSAAADPPADIPPVPAGDPPDAPDVGDQDDEPTDKPAEGDAPAAAETTERAAPEGGAEEDGMTAEEMRAALADAQAEIIRAVGPQVAEQVGKAIEPVIGKLDAQAKDVAEVKRVNGQLLERISKLEKTPEVGRGIVRTVTKDGDDPTPRREQFDPTGKQPLDVMRALIERQDVAEHVAQ
jgi:hypothetical protein